MDYSLHKHQQQLKINRIVTTITNGIEEVVTCMCTAGKYNNKNSIRINCFFFFFVDDTKKFYLKSLKQ